MGLQRMQVGVSTHCGYSDSLITLCRKSKDANPPIGHPGNMSTPGKPRPHHSDLISKGITWTNSTNWPRSMDGRSCSQVLYRKQGRRRRRLQRKGTTVTILMNKHFANRSLTSLSQMIRYYIYIWSLFKLVFTAHL